MALACLAAGLRESGTEVFAFTVDHGLREGSAQEAEMAAAWCGALGLPHRVLHWRGEKPTTGVQAAARHARYRLLVEAAEKEGIDAILTAHSSDDQGESLFMRLSRGAGVQGLSAMSEEVLIAAGAGDPVRLIRPLLGVSRGRLRATVAAHGQDFVDDPSNDDPTYERVRVRALLAALAEQQLLTSAALNRTANSMREAARRLTRDEDRNFQRSGGCFHRWGGASFTASRIDKSFAPVLRRLIHAVSGSDYPPGVDESDVALVQLFDSGAATLGGALMKRKADRFYVLREPAALLGRTDRKALRRVGLSSTGRLVWDGRFVVRCDGAGPGLSLGALSEDGLAALGPRTRIFDAPKEALLTTPAVWRDGAILAVPAVDFWAGTARFVISTDCLTEERYFRRILRYS